MTPESLLFGSDHVELIVTPELEGAKRRWFLLDSRRILIAPSLLKELEARVPLLPQHAVRAGHMVGKSSMLRTLTALAAAIATAKENNGNRTVNGSGAGSAMKPGSDDTAARPPEQPAPRAPSTTRETINKGRATGRGRVLRAATCEWSFVPPASAHGASDETLRRRVAYGGRKGRRAAKRLEARRRRPNLWLAIDLAKPGTDVTAAVVGRRLEDGRFEFETTVSLYRESTEAFLSALGKTIVHGEPSNALEDASPSRPRTCATTGASVNSNGALEAAGPFENAPGAPKKSLAGPNRAKGSADDA